MGLKSSPLNCSTQLISSQEHSILMTKCQSLEAASSSGKIIFLTASLDVDHDTRSNDQGGSKAEKGGDDEILAGCDSMASLARRKKKEPDL